MDARYYNGPEDDRDFGPDDVTRCPDCGVTDAEDCTPECRCEYCVTAAIRQAQPTRQGAA